jgi:type IV secretion system protein VirB1
MLTATAVLALAQIALSCVPHTANGTPRVPPDVVLSVAYAESGWSALAIRDNATGKSIAPPTKIEAEQIAARLIAEGHDPDLGFMQVNAANLAHTGLTISSAFQPCASIRAGAQILLDGYVGGDTAAEQQAAIRGAFSSYNTGSPTAGLKTYAPRVTAAAAHDVIPALRFAGMAPFEPRKSAKSVPDSAPGPPASQPDPFASPANAQADLFYPAQQKVQP